MDNNIGCVDIVEALIEEAEIRLSTVKFDEYMKMLVGLLSEGDSVSALEVLEGLKLDVKR